ncbi:homocysteine S-methyltransferase family protein [Vibrio aquaticus]|uniref:Homocysteine S-methyltransferase family protein n=1 Tax=Vibrio aquaticus TaxID=2496559 RepID=A0A3S0MQX1_9VIBR|nr:homocysteine S-methyltransferase family protein [Vibrio aquaticus]RTZ17927.1 homocysteine S-methyltransferase family protein [Vibrio aquaticus]
MKPITILDGGMGRELKRMGAPFTQPLWSAQALIEAPELVTLAHQNFVDAGAEIIIANSYACVPFHLGDALYQSDGARLAKEAAIIAQNAALAANHQVLVAGALPPAFGSYRPDLFKLTEGEAIFNALFVAQDPHVDIWIAETISSLEELGTIQTVLAQTDKPCHYAFSLLDEPDGEPRLRSGEPIVKAIESVCKLGAEGILFNCSIPEVMAKAVSATKTIVDMRSPSTEIGVYANNFAPIQADHEANDTMQAIRELTPEDYLRYCQSWSELGATILGGCCGIGPEHIEALASWKRSQIE